MTAKTFFTQTTHPLFWAGVLLLGVAPWFISSQYIIHLLILSLLFAILASNWDLVMGYAGIFNFAHTTFFALGAYTAGVLSKTFDISPWLSLAAAVVVAVFAALIVCLPVLRVKGIYVVLVTFAFGQLSLQTIISQSDITGGTQGLVLLPPLSIGGYEFDDGGKMGYYYFMLLLFILSTVYLRYLVNSHFGRSIVALRDNELYAISRGIPIARQRLLTFMASAVFTGAAGGVFASYVGVVSPELFGFSYIVTLLSIILLGGISTIYGSVIGAFILTFISESLADLGPWRFIIISTIIVLVLLLYPGGLLTAFKSRNKRSGD